MFTKLKNLILRELFYLVACISLILAGVVARGIFFDKWYKGWHQIGIAGAIIYVISFIYRLFAWTYRRPREKRKLRKKY